MGGYNQRWRLERGDRWLSEEAAQVLELWEPSGRGGWHPPSKADVVVSHVVWTTEDEPGTGQDSYAGQQWDYLDCRGKLRFDFGQGRELQTLMGLEANVLHEERQCVVLIAVAAFLWSTKGHPPTVEEVQREAQQELHQLWKQAAEAIGALGSMPDRMTRMEADHCIYAQDATTPSPRATTKTFAT